jgi:type IV pilus assembly protein PilC
MVQGVEKAETRTALLHAVGQRGLSLLDAEQKRNLLQFELTRKKVPLKELMHFSRQVAVFLRAGVPVLEAIEGLTEEMPDKFFKNIMVDAAEEIRSGRTFSQAFEIHPDVLPRYYLGILRSAELTGNLDDSLDRLGDYIERDLETRRKITGALAYPAVIAVVAIGAIAVLLGFVMPKFETFFQSFRAKLPLPTRMLLSFSRFVRREWYFIAAVVVLFAVLGFVTTRTERGRYWRDKLLLGIPAIGEVIRMAVLERFCRMMGTMTAAGVPLPEALTVSSDAVSNSVYRQGLADVRAAMIRGEGLATPLAATGLFPAAARQIFRVGEETGTLDDQLDTAATYFDRELDFKIKRLTTFFEPAVILFMGAVVGFVAIALISAMYGIFHQVKV